MKTTAAWSFCCVFVLVWFWTGPAAAEIIVLQPDEADSNDVRARNKIPYTNMDKTGLYLWDTEFGGSYSCVNFLRFDLPASIKDPELVDSATLELFLYKCNDYSGGDNWSDLGCARVKEDWEETVLHWGNKPPTDPISTDSVRIGGLLYREHTYPNIFIKWDVTSLVKEWVDGTWPNYGFIVRLDDPNGNEFWFRDSNHATADERPILRINYIPEPSSIVLLLLGVAGLFRHRWRRGTANR